MRFLLAAGALMAFAGWLHAEPVSLKDGAIAFDTPPGFRQLSAAEIATKFPARNPPAVVYGNNDNTVTVAVTFSTSKVAPSQLEALKTSMEQVLPRAIPNLVWVNREIVNANDRQWVHLEMKSSAIDTDIHNNMYLTSYQGQMLGFNFNATTSNFPTNQKALHESFRSIRIKE